MHTKETPRYCSTDTTTPLNKDEKAKILKMLNRRMFGKKLLLRYNTETEAHILGPEAVPLMIPTFGTSVCTTTSLVMLHKLSFHGDHCCITPPLRITPSSLQVSTSTECLRASFQQHRLQYHLYQQESKGVFISVEYNKYYSLKLLNATSALPHILSTKAEFSMTRFFFFGTPDRDLSKANQKS